MAAWQATGTHFQRNTAGRRAGEAKNITGMIDFKNLMERSAFGVCSYLGEKIGVASARVRMYFIYLSFATLGSPVIFYLFIAFWLNIRNYIKQKRSPLWN